MLEPERNWHEVTDHDFFTAYSTVASTAEGNLVLSHLLSYSGVDEDVFDPDPMVMARNAGMRLCGLEIRNRLVPPERERDEGEYDNG